MTLDQFKQTYEDWKLSGLSVRDYCNNTGFDEGKFYYWRRKLTDSALPDTQGLLSDIFERTKEAIRSRLKKLGKIQ